MKKLIYIMIGLCMFLVSATGQEIYEVGVQQANEGDHLVSDFEDLTINPESYWNGADESGVFITGNTRFYNDYNPEWSSWSGWAYSNTSDIKTPGLLNQYSSITGAGNHKGAGLSEGGCYGVSYATWPSMVDFEDGQARTVAGLFVTNSTYTALSMEQGDEFAKKFGGVDGSDPDYYKLIIWGRADGTATDSIEFYLADFRFDDNEKDYIIKTWQWVDLSSLGNVDSLLFVLTSSDMGDWGMNTPGFFCLDDLHVIPNEVPVVANAIQERSTRVVNVYPNPSTGIFMINTIKGNEMDLKIYSLTGAMVYENSHYESGGTIDMSVQPKGSYMIRITNDQGAISKMIQIL
jgi:hypothetical protein